RGGDDRDSQAAAAAAEVAERGDGPRVGAVKVVEQQRERRVLGSDRDERLEGLDLVEVPPSGVEPELGEDLAEGGRRAAQVDAGERLPERGRERDVRQVLLELGADGATHADVVELTLELVEQPGLAEPSFCVDLDEREVADQRAADGAGELLQL